MREKNNIILCQITAPYSELGHTISLEALSIGPFILRAFCMNHPDIRQSFSFDVAYYNAADEAESICRDIKKREPHIIGFSCYMPGYSKTIEVARLLKQRLKNVMFILGGPCSFAAEDELIRQDVFDVAIPFEGELPFLNLLLSVHNRTPLESVPGIAFRKGGEIVLTAPPQPLKDLSALPRIYTPFFFETFQHNAILYQTSRGCRHKCSYCVSAGTPYRELPFERVENELHCILTQSKIEFVTFTDLDLCDNIPRFKSILNFIIDHNHRGVLFAGFWNSRPNIKQCLELMKKANFTREFNVTLQTGSEKARRLARRTWFSYKHLENVAPEILETFPKARIEMILGLPGETLRTFKDCHLKVFRMGFRRMNPFNLILTPGADYYRRRDEIGFLHEDDICFRIKSTPDMSETDLKDAHRFSKRFQILSWIFDPEDTPLYDDWGIDLIQIADSVPALEKYCLSNSNHSTSFKDVDENAIDVIANYLRDFCGISPEMSRQINEYLHVKFHAYGFSSLNSESISNSHCETDTLIPTFLEEKISPELLPWFGNQGHGSYDCEGRTTIFYLYHFRTQKFKWLTSKNNEIFRSLLEACSKSDTEMEALKQIEPQHRIKAAKIWVFLREAGFSASVPAPPHNNRMNAQNHEIY